MIVKTSLWLHVGPLTSYLKLLSVTYVQEQGPVNIGPDFHIVTQFATVQPWSRQ